MNEYLNGQKDKKDVDLKRNGNKKEGSPSNNKKQLNVPKKKLKMTLQMVTAGLIVLAIAVIILLNYSIMPQNTSKGSAVSATDDKAALVTFAPTNSTANPTPSHTAVQKTVQPTATAVQKTVQPTATAVPTTAWGQKFADKFTDGKVEKTENSYKSATINVTMTKVQKSLGTKDAVTYYIADIYVADLKYFKTAFASGKFSNENLLHTYEIAKANNAILAINGDYCTDNGGPVVRNGVIYRKDQDQDVLVMNNDGSMQTFTVNEFDLHKITGVKEVPYQVWSFGPMLLDNGQPMTKFHSKVTVENPRTAIGYYEPGHYCFVVVDGREEGYSRGYTMKELSQLFYDLGCKVAYNLDGGQSAEMAFEGNLINQPTANGRPVSDIVYIGE